jgi:hypothetical protein
LKVFGPYMRKWGYEFPIDWEEPSVSSVSEAWLSMDSVVRRFYMKNIHYGWVMPTSKRSTVAPPDDE